MEISKETQQKIQELQILEQHLQALLAQKQSFQFELNETLNALDEIKKTKDEIYKILSGVMIRSDKTTLTKEIEEKKKLLELRINSIEKQESLLEKKANELKNEITDEVSVKEKK